VRERYQIRGERQWGGGWVGLFPLDFLGFLRILGARNKPFFHKESRMVQKWILMCALLVLACGNNREAEYPDEEDQSEESSSGDEEQVSSSNAESEEEGEHQSSAVSVSSSSESHDNEQHVPVPPPGQLSPFEEAARQFPPVERTFHGEPADSTDLLFTTPAGWDVREPDMASIWLRHPYTKGLIKVWVCGEDHVSFRASTERLRAEAKSEHRGVTELYNANDRTLGFKYLAKNGREGTVLVVRMGEGFFGPLLICAFGNWERAHSDFSNASLDRLVSSFRYLP
jgi:hypothetical protein